MLPDDQAAAIDRVAPPGAAVDPAVMAPGFRRLTRDSIVYGIGTFSGKAVGLILLPVLARSLSRTDYGVLDVLWSLGAGIAGILVLGLDGAAVRLFFDERIRDRAGLLGTWRAILAGTAAFSGVGLLLAAPAIGDAVLGSRADLGPVYAMALIVPASLVSSFVTTVLRATGRPTAFAVVSVLTFLVYGVGVIGLAATGRATVASTMTTWAVSLIVASAAGLVALRANAFGSVSRENAAHLLRYGLPLAPVLAVTLANDFVQRAILFAAAGPAEVAQLTVALRFASVLALGVTAFQLAWQPRIFAMGTSELALRRIGLDCRRFLALASGGAIVLASAMPIAVPIVAGEPYRDALPTVGWCVAAALVGAAYAMAISGSLIAQRPADVTRSTALGIAVAVVANLVLAPRFGSVGTGAALVAGQAVATGLAIVASGRAQPFPGPWSRSAISVAVGALASIVATADGVAAPVRAVVLLAALAALTLDPAARETIRLAARRGRP
jgi:O-antigen/teichoic acid export membrane protein